MEEEEKADHLVARTTSTTPVNLVWWRGNRSIATVGACQMTYHWPSPVSFFFLPAYLQFRSEAFAERPAWLLSPASFNLRLSIDSSVNAHRLAFLFIHGDCTRMSHASNGPLLTTKSTTLPTLRAPLIRLITMRPSIYKN